MFSLKKAKLPQAIEVGGSFYKIHTNYKYFLRLRELLNNKTAGLTDFDFMYIDKIPPGRLEGIRALCEFMNPPQELPRMREKGGERVLDYEIDAPYIYAAFMEQYGIDLIDTRLHWYKFVALLHGLHDTELNRIINARLYKPSGKNSEYEKAQQKQHEAWKLPEADEPDEALDEFLKQIK